MSGRYARSCKKVHRDRVMHSITSATGAQVKYTRLDPDRRIEVTKSSLNILEKALIVQLIHSTDASGLPLGSNASVGSQKRTGGQT